MTEKYWSTKAAFSPEKPLSMTRRTATGTTSVEAAARIRNTPAISICMRYLNRNGISRLSGFRLRDLARWLEPV